MLKELTQGIWSRPTDKSAVYLEIAPGNKWGIRVTLIDNYAKVEAVDGPKATWYKAAERYSSTIKPPNLLEKIRGVTLEDKIMAAVEDKRNVARQENGK